MHILIIQILCCARSPEQSISGENGVPGCETIAAGAKMCADPVALALCRNTALSRAASHCERANRFLKTAASHWPTWERNLQVIVCADISAANSPCCTRCSGISSPTSLLTNVPPPPPPLLKVLTADLKIAARSFPHLTLSPSSSARSKHFAHLPETIPSCASRYR